MHHVCHFWLFLTHASGISNNPQNIKTYPVSGTIPGGRKYTPFHYLYLTSPPFGHQSQFPRTQNGLFRSSFYMIFFKLVAA